MPDECHDVILIGGGIVGLSTAWEFSRRFPQLRLLLLEKEARLASHQSGRNSGVIHSGIYYRPGSMKAKTCVQGCREMVQFCREHAIPCQVSGKVIVATTEGECFRLEELRKRGEANGISGLRLLERDELREIEPYCGGLRALHVPSAGITDYAQVSQKFGELFSANGGQIQLLTRVRGLVKRTGQIIVETTRGNFTARHVVNCAGLYSDVITRLANDAPEARIAPFRGEYYELVPEREHLVRSLIYPVPDARFPFLGVHFTRRVKGGVDAGPNAVLALKREGYRRTDFSFKETLEQLAFPGFWRMGARYWRTGFAELYRSFSKRAFVRALERLVPEIRSSDLVRAGAGVRAQALERNGSLLDDFRFQCSHNVLHVLNVPSPAATASIVLGRAIVAMASERFSLGA
ncbi:MAG: L-2-hydroxyglutarate oxidase [Acidobacteria bacterium]|nr:L-2-hydroxyglutarate oxidase [Acidobacteriota bacterium]